MRLKVSRKPDGSPEIFYSIQGEGVNAGRPAVFLRLILCNLKCSWCDTKYTWDWQSYDPKQQAIQLSSQDIEKEVLKHDCRYLVVTGGEPMLQQKALLPLLEQLKASGLFVEIETNGTILPDAGILSAVDHWSVSPKLANSGNLLSTREIAQCYILFARLPSCHFKYVIQNRRDFAEVRRLMQKYGISPQKIVLMPQGRTTDEVMRRSTWVVELCKAEGCLFSTRLQVLLWGNERGV